MVYDILITDGMVIDGTGNQRFLADIGIKDGLIHEIGVPKLAGADAKVNVSAFGKFVVPGFVDITSHADQNWSLFLNPSQDYLLAQGVTSILVGNCGTSLAPLISEESIASLKKWDQTGGSNINWVSTKEFLDELGRHPLGVNVGTLVGHGTIRRGVTHGATRPLTKEETAETTGVLARSLADGAFGLSTGLSFGHEGAASTDELVAIARVVAERGGIYKTHLRDEGADLIPAVNEAIHISREARTPVVISHAKAVGRKAWPSFGNALAMVERAAEAGHAIRFDISPYERTGSFLYVVLPAWAREGGFDAMIQRIKDPLTKPKIISELKNMTIWPERYIVSGAAMLQGGHTLAEIARNTGLTTEEAILELLVLNHGKVFVFGKVISSKNVADGIRHPQSIIASNGSGVSQELERSGRIVHPRSTGTFPHFLHRFVRDEKILSWEAAIAKMTSAPADAVGFAGRGYLAPRHRADVAVFDPETIRDRSTYQTPFLHAAGMDTVIVNGVVALRDGRATGAVGGQVLRKS